MNTRKYTVKLTSNGWKYRIDWPDGKSQDWYGSDKTYGDVLSQIQLSVDAGPGAEIYMQVGCEKLIKLSGDSGDDIGFLKRSMEVYTQRIKEGLQ